MLKATLKGRASTLSKTLLTAGLLGGAAAGVITVFVAPAEAGTYDFSFKADGIDVFLKLITGDNLITKTVPFDPLGLPGYSFQGYEILSVTGFDEGKAVTALMPDGTKLFSPTSLGYGTDNLFFPIIGDNQPDQFSTGQIGGGFAYETADGELYQFYYGSIPGDATIKYQGCEKPSPTSNGCIQRTITDVRTDVPAPLPLLGVAAAFGSLRKLRKFSSQLKTFSMG